MVFEFSTSFLFSHLNGTTLRLKKKNENSHCTFNCLHFPRMRRVSTFQPGISDAKKTAARMIISRRFCAAQRNFFRRVARGFFSSPARTGKAEDCYDSSGSIQEVPEGDVQSCILGNGMQLVAECKDSFTTTVGCFLPAGAMYELPEERGSALFMEHLLFKRTSRRSKEKFEEELQDVGGRIDVLTRRDMFTFYGTVPSCSVEKLVELFADVILNGVVCDEDVVAAKSVILKDLASMESDREKVIMDYLKTMAYQGTVLGNSIYPETALIKNFCTESLNRFRNRLLETCSMTMVSTGSITLQELHAIVCKHFTGEVEECEPLSGEWKIKCEEAIEFRFSGADLRFRDDDEELGFVGVAVEGPGCEDRQDHFACTVAKEIVGSWDKAQGGGNHNAPYLAHCAFNTDMCHLYKSFYFSCAQTTGLWGCYFVCDKLQLEDMMFMLQKEWMRLCTTITQKEVERAVNQCKMYELMKLNDPVDRYFDIVNSLFRFGCYESVRERVLRYEKVTADSIREVAGKYIYDRTPVVVGIGRIENLTDYCNIQQNMYLLRF